MAIQRIVPIGQKSSLPLPNEPFRLPFLFNKTRFLVLIISLLCMTAVSANSLLLNFTIICMSPEANFTSYQEGILLAGTAVGGIIAIGPVPPLISLIGLRLVFSTFGLLSGVTTALLPLLFRTDPFWSLLAFQFLQGFCLMPAMPAISQVTHHWANGNSPGERALFLTVLSIYMQLGIVLTMPITGLLCNSAGGWQSAYYLFGLISVLLFLLFLAIYRNSPQESPFLSVKEATELAAAKNPPADNHPKEMPSNTNENNSTQERTTTPYWQMFKDTAVWACLASGIGSGLAYWIFAQYGPTYMNKVLDYKVDSTGIWVAVPHFLSILCKLMVPLMERLAHLSPRARLVWFNFGCHLVNVACFLLLAFCPSANPVLTQAAIIVVLCANATGFVELVSNCQVIARQHAHFILALYALVDYVIVLVQPLVIAWAAASKDRAELATQWSHIFFVYAALLFFLNIIYAAWARIQPRKWTN